LAEHGIFADAVFGCSVGAVNAAALAADPTTTGVERMVETWGDLDSEVICPPGRLSGLLLLTRKYRSLQSNDALRHLLEDSLTYRRFEDTAIPLAVVATSLRTGREHWFTSGPVIPAVLASAALPAVFPPVEIGGESFIDGGVVDNVPISRAVAGGFDRVFVLHVGNFDRPRAEPRRPIDALLQSFSIARNYRFHTEVEAPPEGVELVVLPSVDPGHVKPNDFGKSKALIERSHAATAAFLDHGRRLAAGN
jgi:NTE family protein